MRWWRSLIAPDDTRELTLRERGGVRGSSHSHNTRSTLLCPSVIILSKPKMFNSFNQLLITLSTLDSIFIVLAIYDYSWVR